MIMILPLEPRAAALHTEPVPTGYDTFCQRDLRYALDPGRETIWIKIGWNACLGGLIPCGIIGTKMLFFCKIRDKSIT